MGAGVMSMLRKTFLALTFAAALAAPSFAQTQAARAEGMEIRQAGVVQGRVTDVERDEQGRIVSIAASGLEAPADAPPTVMAPRRPSPVIVAEGLSEPDDAPAPRPLGHHAR